jgi:hypothetical protein
MEWDEEELATNIYDQPQDAEDSVVDDRPDLSEIELSADGAPVPHPSLGGPSSAAPTREQPAHHNKSPQEQLAALPTAIGKPGRNGSAPRAAANPFDFVLPEPAVPAVPLFDGRGNTGPAVRHKAAPSRGVMYGAAAGVTALLGLAGLLFYSFFVGGRPGEVTILSDPASSVQVLLDNQRVHDGNGTPIDGTPAVVPLKPGSYVLTVQREGYVPWNEQVEIKAGEKLTVRAKLEPLASTGFTLVSEPAGATAILDGKALDGLTPLKVESMLPGKHRIEVRSAAGQWSQEVTIEAGRMIDLRAVLAAIPAPPPVAPPVAAVVVPPKPVTPPPPVARAPEPVAPKPVEKEPVRQPVKVAAVEKPAEPVRKVARELPRPPPPKEDKPKPAQAAPKKPPAGESDDDDDSNLPPPTRAKPATPPPAKPATPAAKPATASGAGEGYLRLGSKPWTNIAVDGKDTGLHTPQLKIKLAPGSHRITLSNPQFNIKETFSVDIKAGAEETVIKDLRPQNNDDSD